MLVAVLCGGRSGEHEISVLSCRSVFQSLLDSGFDVILVGITREGQWVFVERPEKLLLNEDPEVTADLGPSCYILPDPQKPGIWINGQHNETGNAENGRRINIDVVFPVLHGTFGEDGAIQGLLELSGIPYVGSGTLASALCMDKDTAKMVLTNNGVPCVPSITVKRWRWREQRAAVLDEIRSQIKYPVFVKPSASGSSLGVSKVKRSEDLPRAIDDGFLYDLKVLIEPSQEGALEIEFSVLGNDKLMVSVPGQIVPVREFYDYHAKYYDEATKLIIPAPLDEELTRKAQKIVAESFKCTGCSGLARVDLFVKPDTGEIYVNELNTMPGFTDVSMYPKLWEASGLPYSQLVSKLVELAIGRQKV